MNALRKWLRRWCLTADQRVLVETLETPARWVPAGELTHVEREEWRKLLTSPLLQKIDGAMINLCCDQAQRALFAPTEETVRQAGYALGYRAAWEMAKTLSTIGAAEGTNSEDSAATGADPLAHLNP